MKVHQNEGGLQRFEGLSRRQVKVFLTSIRHELIRVQMLEEMGIVLCNSLVF